MPEATTKLAPCQVRINTQSPCPRRAKVEILGVAFCGPCARQQEAYFAIGELTQEETMGLRSKPLAEALEKLRRERDLAGGSLAPKRDRNTINESLEETESRSHPIWPSVCALPPAE